MNNTRGTEELVGDRIMRVDTTSINVIHLHMESGKIISVDAENSHYGIPVIGVSKGYQHETTTPTPLG